MRARGVPLLLLACMATALLAPLAQADHVFSHRTYIVGRVVDSEGKPAPGLPVTVTFTNLTADKKCPILQNNQETTGPQGDYLVCRHTHALPQNASVTVTVGNVSGTARVDADLRHAVVHLQLDAPATTRDINGQRLFERTYHVQGRAFTLLKEPVDAENVKVNATPREGLNASVSLVSDGAVLAQRNVTADDMGIYRADLDVQSVPEGATVHVLAGGIESTERASALFRRSDVNVVRDLRTTVSLDEVPGSTPTPLPALVPLAAVALAAAAAYRRRTK